MKETIWVLESPETGASVVVGRGPDRPAIKPVYNAVLKRYLPVMDVIRRFGTFVVAWWAVAAECRRNAYHMSHNNAPILAGRSDGLQEAAEMVATELDALSQTDDERAWIMRMANAEIVGANYVSRAALEVLLRRAGDLLGQSCGTMCFTSPCASCALRADINSALNRIRP